MMHLSSLMIPMIVNVMNKTMLEFPKTNVITAYLKNYIINSQVGLNQAVNLMFHTEFETMNLVEVKQKI